MHAFSDRGVWDFFSHDVSLAFAFTPLNNMEKKGLQCWYSKHRRIER